MSMFKLMFGVHAHGDWFRPIKVYSWGWGWRLALFKHTAKHWSVVTQVNKMEERVISFGGNQQNVPHQAKEFELYSVGIRAHWRILGQEVEWVDFTVMSDWRGIWGAQVWRQTHQLEGLSEEDVRHLN
jgi:hypothetical protein